MVKKKQTLSKHKLQTNIKYFWYSLFKLNNQPIELTDYQHKIASCKKRRILVVGGRRSGKTVLGAGEGIRYATLHKNEDVICFAPSWEIARIFMDTVKDLLHSGPLENSIATELSFEVTLTNRSRIMARTLSKTSKTARGHGRRVGKLILEDVAYTPEECLIAVRPIRLDKRAQEMWITTPLGHNHVYRAWNSKKFECFRIKTDENPYLDLEELEVDKALMSELEFKQEYEAEFLDDEYIVFSDSLIAAATQNDLQFIEKLDEEKQYCNYAALDLARKRDKAVLFIVNDRTPHVDLLKIHQFPKFSEGKFWSNLIDHTCRFCKLFKVRHLVIDQTGIGDKPVLDIRDEMTKRSIPCRVTGIMISKYNKPKLFNNLLLKFERMEFHFPFHKEFIRQLKNIRRKTAISPNKAAQITADFETIGHDDIVYSACMVLQACPRTVQMFHSKAVARKERAPDQILGGKVVSSAFNL